MKSYSLIFILLFLGFSNVYAQILPYLGIYNLDSCSFESACKYVSFPNDSNNIWQLGKPNKVFFDSAYSGTYAVITDTINPYPASNHSYFDIQIVSNTSSPNGNRIVGFKHQFETDSLKDGGFIEASYDNGKTWINAINQHPDYRPIMFRTENFYSNKDTLLNGKIGFSGKSKGWIYSRIQWIWVMPRKKIPDTIILRFNFISDSIQTNKAGWMIDDLMISRVDQGSSVNSILEHVPYFEITPNPMNDKSRIQIIGNSGINYTVSVLNILGQTVKNIEIINEEALLSNENLKQGIYFVQLKNESQIIATKKIVVE